MAATYEIRIVSDSRQADKEIAALEKRLNEVTKPKKVSFQFPSLQDVGNGFKQLQQQMAAAAQMAQQVYQVLRQIPTVGPLIQSLEARFQALTLALVNLPRTIAQAFSQASTNILQATDLTRVFTGTLGAASTAINALVINIAKIGFAFFGVQQAVMLLKSAYMGFFNETVAREIKLRETLLKTQTTLASTSRVFAGGKEVTDPYQKIVTLTSAIEKNVDSIRLRSLELAGVTSDEVIGVFNIVASQIGQVGGNLKDAENLAIKFAAALGTFGIPIEQANQEIGSMLRGDITQDSYLARSLGITNQDIAKARTQAGGVIKFIEDRLATSQAGQKIAADSFSGITSNIQDIVQLVSQNFGRGLLDPLLSGLRAVYTGLKDISKELIGIASMAGESIGRIGTMAASTFANTTGIGNINGQAAAERSAQFLQKAFVELEAVARRTFNAIAAMVEKLGPSLRRIGESALLFGKAVIQLNVAKFSATVDAVTALVQVFGGLLEPVSRLVQLYAALAATPVVRFFGEVTAILTVLKRAGLDTLMTFVALSSIVINTLGPMTSAVVGAGGAILGTIAGITVAIGKLLLALGGLAAAFVSPLAAIPAAQAAMRQFALSLEQTGNQALATNGKLAVLQRGLAATGAAAKGALANFVAGTLKFAAIQVGLALLIKAFADFQKAADDARSIKAANKALDELSTKYKDVDESSSAAARASKAFNESLVSGEYNRAQTRLREINSELENIQKNLAFGINSWGEFFKRIGGGFLTGDKDLYGFDKNNLEKEKKRLEEFMRKRDELEDSQRNNDNVTTAANAVNQDFKRMADARKQLEREVIDFRRSQEATLFGKRQEIARKEVDIVQAAGELRIQGIERANRKLLEGVEGSAKTALAELDTYIASKERSELELQATERNFQIDMADLERSVVDFRIDSERRIADIREKIAKYEMEVSQWRIRAAAAEAAARQSGMSDSAGGMSPLMQRISGKLFGVESANDTAGNGYNSFNLGGRNGGREAIGSGVDPSLSQNTVQNIMDRQSRVGGLHAVGRYQIIGSTLKGLMDPNGPYGNVGVKPTDKFDAATQDKFFQALFKARVQPYLDGKATLDQTVQQLRFEWVGLERVGTETIKGWVKEFKAGGGQAGSASGAYLQGNIGPTSTGPHFDVKKLTGERYFKRDALDQFVEVNGKPLSSGETVRGGTFAGHQARGSHGWDYAFGDGRHAATLKGGAKWLDGQPTAHGEARKFQLPNGDVYQFLHGKSEGITASSPGAAAPAVNLTPPPTPPTLDASILQSAQNFENLVTRLRARSRELLDIQQQIKKAALADQFDQIGNNLFPKQEESIRQIKVGLEDIEARLKAVAEAGPGEFDQQAFDLGREVINFNKEAERTLQLFVDGVKKRNLTEAETVKLTEKAIANYERAKEENAEIVRLKEQQVQLERQAAFIGELKGQIKSFDQDTRKRRLDVLGGMATSLIPEGPGSILRAREIEAEVDISKRRIDAEAANKGPLTGQALEDFNILAEKIRASAKEFGALEEAMKAYNEKLAMARQVTESVVGGAKGLISSVFKGGDFKQAFSQYLSNVGGNLVDMGLNGLMKPVEQTFQKQMEGLFGAKLERDPMQLLQEQNNQFLTENTQALLNLTQNLSALSGFAPQGGEAPIGDFSGAFAPITTSLEGTFTQFATSFSSQLATSLSSSNFNVGALGLNLAQSFLPKILGGLFGGFFAEGGDPPIGKFSIVGENGPEIIVPKNQRTVIPLKKGGAAGSTLPQLATNARQRLLEQGRQARDSEMPIPDYNPSFKVDFSGQPLQFNSEDYVPKSAIPTLMQRGAKESYNYMRNKLRRSPAERRAFGL